MSNQQKPEPAQTTALAAPTTAAIGTSPEVHALVPTTLDGAMQFAEWLAKSSLLPKAVNKVHDIFFIVCAGMELGLPPMAALRGLYTVHGRTALESKTKAALCIDKKKAIYFKRVEYTPQATTWETCRVGQEPVQMRYTLAEARAAWLAPDPTASPARPGKEGPWRDYTQRMISHRALGWICDDVYPDVVMGVATAEDFDPGDFTYKPVGGGSAEMSGRSSAPEVVSGPPAAAKQAGEQPAPAAQQQEFPRDTSVQGDGRPAGAHEPKAATPTPAAKKPKGKPLTDEPEIVELEKKIGTFVSRPELKKWAADNVNVRDMSEEVRARMANAYSNQCELIDDAAKAEKAQA